jgi:hypothetical protein
MVVGVLLLPSSRPTPGEWRRTRGTANKPPERKIRMVTRVRAKGFSFRRRVAAALGGTPIPAPTAQKQPAPRVSTLEPKEYPHKSGCGAQRRRFEPIRPALESSSSQALSPSGALHLPETYQSRILRTHDESTVLASNQVLGCLCQAFACFSTSVTANGRLKLRWIRSC